MAVDGVPVESADDTTCIIQLTILHQHEFGGRYRPSRRGGIHRKPLRAFHDAGTCRLVSTSAAHNMKLRARKAWPLFAQDDFKVNTKLTLNLGPSLGCHLPGHMAMARGRTSIPPKPTRIGLPTGRLGLLGITQARRLKPTFRCISLVRTWAYPTRFRLSSWSVRPTT